eukprot:SM000031S11635  [mRNA]  locus=s31:903983:905475:- [translate_table: standard]
MHSHEYRVPEPFTGLSVVVIGAASSGEDIAREVATLAREVHICSRHWLPQDTAATPHLLESPPNLWRRPMRALLVDAEHWLCGVGPAFEHFLIILRVVDEGQVTCASADGTVTFGDGHCTHADVILHCTGYLYSLPFLDVHGAVEVADNCVTPVYQHVFPPSFAPTLSFVGLPWKVVPFLLCEMQSKWIAMVLAGSAKLPARCDMQAVVAAEEARVAEAGCPRKYYHCMDNNQFQYVDWLAAACGLPPLPAWRERMYIANRELKKSRPVGYRDA